MTLMDRFRLDGRVAIVTGATSGLGVAFATALAEAGAQVVLGGRRADRLESTRELISSLGGEAIAVRTDVTKPDECQALAAAAGDRFGRLDVLVNGAGIASAVPALRETPDQFRHVIDTNLMGTYWMSQACAQRMGSGSSIVNIGSVIGLTSAGLPQAAYSASKAAIIGLTRDLAQQWSGRKSIRVNAIAPGYFPTEMTEELTVDFLRYLTEDRVPMGRLGELSECAAAVVFLASDAASYITGVCLPVDGGLLTF